MVRKRKKLILLLIALLSAVAAFFIVTRKISESHKKEHSIIKTEDYKSYIQKYGTGETLQYSYFTDNSGITKENLLYIILEVNDKGSSSNQETERYYIKEKAIIEKILQALNETDYHVSGMEFRNSKSDDYSSACRIRFAITRRLKIPLFLRQAFSAVKTCFMVWRRNGLINIFLMVFLQTRRLCGYLRIL